VKTTSDFSSSFATNRYVEFDFNSPQPAGLSVSSAAFNFRMAANGASETACFYFEVYQASTSTLLATYGSTGTPVGCNLGVQTSYTTTITQITSTDTLNDLRIRVYGKNSASHQLKIDQATVTGMAIDSFTLYEEIYRDQSTGTATTTNWAIAMSGDGVNFVNLANWSTTFSILRYGKFSFDPHVPAGAVVTSAHLKLYYHSNTAGNTACWYFETYNGLTLLGTHGSSGTPQSCQTGNTTYSTDDVTLSELTSVTDANALTVKVYFKESGSRKVQVDFVQLELTYYLD
jgi:hypothetical protein